MSVTHFTEEEDEEEVEKLEKCCRLLPCFTGFLLLLSLVRKLQDVSERN